MAEAHDTRQILYQNLIDAACPPELTEECMALAEQGNSGVLPSGFPVSAQGCSMRSTGTRMPWIASII